jgi:hypothetical protein
MQKPCALNAAMLVALTACDSQKAVEGAECS